MRRTAVLGRLTTATRILLPSRIFSVGNPLRSLSEPSGNSPINPDEVAPVSRLPKSWIAYEDEWFVVLDKPCGVLSQDGRIPGDSIASMTRSLGWKLVHRLDYECSGALVLCKTREAAAIMSSLLARGSSNTQPHHLQKTYVAVVVGIPKQQQGE
jgi:23S rRNA-/tRNA-specific pseudouridylate synthase